MVNILPLLFSSPLNALTQCFFTRFDMVFLCLLLSLLGGMMTVPLSEGRVLARRTSDRIRSWVKMNILAPVTGKLSAFLAWWLSCTKLISAASTLPFFKSANACSKKSLVNPRKSRSSGCSHASLSFSRSLIRSRGARAIPKSDSVQGKGH